MSARGLGVSILLASLALSACDDEPRTIAIEVLLGHEDDAMRADPAVTSVAVELRDAEGTVVAESAAAPGGELELGEVDADAVVRVSVVGRDASGEVVVRGRSLSFPPSALSGDSLPVFAQRLGAFSRPPGSLVRAHVGGVATVIGERWVLSTGGDLALGADGADADPGAADFYDLLAWGGAESTVLPRRARSIVSRGAAALLIDDFGATWFDFEAGTSVEVEAPEGLSFGLVAGGPTVDGPDGVSFVVGPARRADAPGALPTRDVLRVGADGQLTAASLQVSRAGAATTWVDGVGLVVAGGADQDAGVEVLGLDESLARTLPFPSDRTDGAALAPIGEATVARIGGRRGDEPAPTAFLSLSCADACAPDELAAEASIPVGLRGTVAFGTGAGILAIGRDEVEGTRAFVVPLDRSAPVEVALREPRRGAAVAAAPNGTLLVVGGQREDGEPAVTAESWFPE